MAAQRDREVALDLMRMALPLLDRAGEVVAAARLQGAIDDVGRDAGTPAQCAAGTDDDRTWSIMVPLPAHLRRT